ncbi:hypothetical protein PHYC_00174 [Phycisphaerales bacterium]|nr:hypothetical protein PHYC_00174 [Phycisphaerales bacterium]
MHAAVRDSRQEADSLGRGRDRRRSATGRRRYHFHGPGVAYAATLVVIMMGAINGQNNVLFWLFGLGVAGLLISGILSGAALMGLVVEREMPAVGTRGEALTVRYHVRNRNRIIPSFAMTIEELPGGENSADGPTWRDHFPGMVAFAAHVPARGESTAEATSAPSRRGLATFREFRVSTTFPFGLTKKSVTFRQEGELLIRPRCVPVNETVLQGRGEGQGQGRLMRRGRTGDEFFALREYVPGDGMRRVAWRSSARLDRVVVREMASLPARRVLIVAAPLREGSEGEACVEGAAGLARAALRRGLEVGIAAADGRMLVAPRSGERSLGRCLDALAVVEPGERLIMPAVQHGDSVVVVTEGEGRSVGAGVTSVRPRELGVQVEPRPAEQSDTTGLIGRVIARMRGAS